MCVLKKKKKREERPSPAKCKPLLGLRSGTGGSVGVIQAVLPLPVVLQRAKLALGACSFAVTLELKLLPRRRIVTVSQGRAGRAGV